MCCKIFGTVTDCGNVSLRSAVGNYKIKARAVEKFRNLLLCRCACGTQKFKRAAEALVNTLKEFFAEHISVFFTLFKANREKCLEHYSCKSL